jgi:hypothetical protein
MPKFHGRSFVSLLISLSFLVVFASGLVLWLSHSPQTLGVSKGAWKHVHIFTSLLMAVAAVWHFVLNWSAYRAYLWEAAARRLARKWELTLALAITAGIAGTAALDRHDDMMQRFTGMNLRQVADMTGQPVDSITAVLKKEGLDIHDVNHSLREIAEDNKVSPMHVTAILQRQRDGQHGHR